MWLIMHVFPELSIINKGKALLRFNKISKNPFAWFLTFSQAQCWPVYHIFHSNEVRRTLCSATVFLFCWTWERPNVSKKGAGSLSSPSYRSASSKGMEEESAVSSRYSVELSLSNPRSGTSSISESKSVGARELFPLRTINLKATNHKDATKVRRKALRKAGMCTGSRSKEAEQVFCESESALWETLPSILRDYKNSL